MFPQAGRQLRFTRVRQIVAMQPIIKAYINEAIEVEKAGLKVNFKKSADYKLPQGNRKRVASHCLYEVRRIQF